MATARFDFHGPTFQIAWAGRGAAEQDENEAWEFSRIGGWPARMLRSIENSPRPLSASLTMPCVGRVGSQSVREICFRRWLVVELRTLAVAKRSDPAWRLARQFCSAPAPYRLGEFSPAYPTYVSVNLCAGSCERIWRRRQCGVRDAGSRPILHGPAVVPGGPPALLIVFRP
jgi:hypothetical protein